MNKHNLIFAIVLCLLSLKIHADESLLAANHPDQYTVVKGDTLWDISAKFLKSPWHWPKIWQANQQIANPHLIYPGDELVLVYIDGKPQLQIKKRNRHVKLSPHIRSTPWDGAIPVIPLNAIEAFLTRPSVINKDDETSLPYIVAFSDGRVIAGTDQIAYVRSIDNNNLEKFDIIRPGAAYKDTATGEILGYKATLIGSTKLINTGNPAKFTITSVEEEVLIGDRLIPSHKNSRLSAFTPTPPSAPVNGTIIDVFNGVTNIGQYSVVALDRGERDGLEAGTVLRINNLGPTVLDKVTKDRNDTVKLPNEKAGVLMVFRTFEKISFALVMSATRAIHVRDQVVNP